jgi:hypothetical protein
MFPFVEDAPSAVQFMLLVACAIMGLSHIVRPAMWVEFFTHLHAKGVRGVVMKTFMLELWPALLIVTLHQVWWGPGIVLTLYGWAQLTKVTVAMLAPEIGLRSMAMAQKGDRAFVLGGAMLLVVGAFAGTALFWPS